jgi:hypothetical protein
MEEIMAKINCKEIVEYIIDFINAGLDDKTLEELEKHQRDCPECKAFVNTYKKMLQLTGNIKENKFVTPGIRMRLKKCLKLSSNNG